MVIIVFVEKLESSIVRFITEIYIIKYGTIKLKVGGGEAGGGVLQKTLIYEKSKEVE